MQVDMHLKIHPKAADDVALQEDVAVVEPTVTDDSWSAAYELLTQSTQMMLRLTQQQAKDVKHVAVSHVEDAQARVVHGVEIVQERVNTTKEATKIRVANLSDDVAHLKETTRSVTSAYAEQLHAHIKPLQVKTVAVVEPLAHKAAEALEPLKAKAVNTIEPLAHKAVEKLEPLKAKTIVTLEQYPQLKAACVKTWQCVEPFVPQRATSWWNAATAALSVQKAI